MFSRLRFCLSNRCVVATPSTSYPLQKPKQTYHLTPLAVAAVMDQEVVAKVLLGRTDVDINSRDDLGQTPLAGAASCGSEAVVKLLLSRKGIDVHSKDSQHRTPRERAVTNGFYKVAQLLEEHDRA